MIPRLNVHAGLVSLQAFQPILNNIKLHQAIRVGMAGLQTQPTTQTALAFPFLTRYSLRRARRWAIFQGPGPAHFILKRSAWHAFGASPCLMAVASATVYKEVIRFLCQGQPAILRVGRRIGSSRLLPPT